MSSVTDQVGEPDPSPSRCDVVILGASFAGIEVLLQLQRRVMQPLRIIVVDRQTTHGYIPLVHERLCGHTPEPSAQLDSAAFVQSLPGVQFINDEIVGLDPKAKRVTLGSSPPIEARFVVVALGSVFAPPTTLPGAEHLLRYKYGEQFVRARTRLSTMTDGASATGAPRVIVVGGGISGVELAGELATMHRTRSEGRRVAVTLVASHAMLLPELSRGVGRKAAAALQAQGVEVCLNTRLVRADADAVVLRDGTGTTTTVPCNAALWAGGVAPAPILADLGLPRTDQGWLAVGPTLQCFPTPIPEHPEVFACGDAVRVIGGTGPWPTMQRAIECLWQAKVVARNLAVLANCAPDYPQGVPALTPHVLRRRFAYGVSVGARSLVVYGAVYVDLPWINRWFRRWLMRQYFARYAPVDG